MKSTKELVGASTSLLVLSVLAKEASYGYQIIKRINDAADGLFVWQEGTIYPILHKLEQDKYVRAQWQQAETGRERKYYYITAKGREKASLEKQDWDTFSRIVQRLAEAPNV